MQSLVSWEMKGRDDQLITAYGFIHVASTNVPASGLGQLDLAVPDDLDAILVERALGNNLVATDAGEDDGPEDPVDTTENENQDTDDGEDVVSVCRC